MTRRGRLSGLGLPLRLRPRKSRFSLLRLLCPRSRRLTGGDLDLDLDLDGV
jgi:hypothetical protein